MPVDQRVRSGEYRIVTSLGLPTMSTI